MGFLIVSLIALAAGPVLARLAGRVRPLLAGLDGFVFVAILGLCAVEILPHAAEATGWAALPIAAAALLILRALERQTHGQARVPDAAARWIVLAGFLLHESIDGVALAASDGHALPVAIVLHRLPVGLTVWYLFRGSRTAVAALAGLAATTVLGYALGAELHHALEGTASGVFQAIMAGALVHLALHRHDEAPLAGGAPQPHRHDDHAHHDHHHDAHHQQHHPHDDTHQHPTHFDQPALHGHRKPWHVVEGVGGLVALAFIGLAEPDAVHELAGLVGGAWAVCAPALFAGLALSILAAASTPPLTPGELRGGGPLGAAARGLAIAAARPVCSCGVVPLYRSLLAHGAAAPAALAFLFAAPALSLVGAAMAWPLLGPGVAGGRLFLASALAVALGALVGRVAPRRSHLPLAAQPVAEAGFAARFALAARWAVGDLLDHDLPWLVTGVLVAGFAAPHVDDALFATTPDAVLIVGAALAGLPLYIGVAGAAPLALLLLLAGAPLGAAVAFLLVAPAPGLSTLAALGARVAAVAALLLVGLASLLGALAGALLPDAQPAVSHTLVFAWAALALVTMVLLRLGPRGLVEQLVPSAHHH